MNQRIEDQLYAHIFAGQPLIEHDIAAIEQSRELQMLRDNLCALAEEMRIYGQSQPSAAMVDSYHALYQQMHTSTEPTTSPETRTESNIVTSAATRLDHMVQSLSDWLSGIQVQLEWDSRLQPSTISARTAGATDYRLLFSATTADIELYIEPNGAIRKMVGEILPSTESSDGTNRYAPALLHLQQDGHTVSQAVSDDEGRFNLQSIRPVHTNC